MRLRVNMDLPLGIIFLLNSIYLLRCENMFSGAQMIIEYNAFTHESTYMHVNNMVEFFHCLNFISKMNYSL